jgi:hypothetical protein
VQLLRAGRCSRANHSRRLYASSAQAASTLTARKAKRLKRPSLPTVRQLYYVMNHPLS